VVTAAGGSPGSPGSPGAAGARARAIKVGVVLPSFRSTADDALDVARRADDAGVDGVFCYDHLWPMGRPDRPALAPFPLLAAVAARSSRLTVGPLVARVGLVPERVLVAEFAALAALAPDRVVAALGTGDRLSAAENEAYGLPFPPAADRRDELRRCARALRDDGLPVWVGVGEGTSASARATIAVAENEGVAVNLWGAPLSAVADQASRSEVTWAGSPPENPAGEIADDLVVAWVRQLADAGATWAVFGWPVPLDVLAVARDA
jgi:alkanesulfonate monooxygenase SsuD/methylene tetrahydromethanopterin reductase-like flavin-dependent oxidoreductase (luciferase family)